MFSRLYILFQRQYQELVDEKYIAELERLKQELAEKQVEFAWQFVTEELQVGESMPSDALYIVDSPSNFEILKLRGYYVIALMHEGNPEVAFKGNCYVMEGLEGLDFAYLDLVFRRLAGLPWDILETNRLMVRETTVEDVEDFYRIYAEPSITYYMEDLFKEPDMEREYIRNYIKQVYGFYDYGMWTVVLKETGQVIGRAGISIRDGYELPELGFVIEVAHQKKGYAHEVCSAIMAYAKEELHTEAMQALVCVDNEASVSLLKKLGFSYCKNVVENEQDYMLFIKDLMV